MLNKIRKVKSARVSNYFIRILYLAPGYAPTTR